MLRRSFSLSEQKQKNALADVLAMVPLELRLPDPDDVHVVQTAVAVQILTFNVRDFPPEELATVDLERVHPDESLRHLCDLYPVGVVGVLSVVVCRVEVLNNPPEELVSPAPKPDLRTIMACWYRTR
jgi:hypothetical protein